MNRHRSIIIITTPPHNSTAPKEALDTALALAVFDLDVTVVLHGAGVIHAVPPPESVQENNEKSKHGSLFSKLGALGMYDIPKVQVLEDEWSRYAHQPPPEWVELKSGLLNLFVRPYQVHVY
jgi:sulfur relay (sulfurtransferase) DsrF/TusC family protein